MITLLPLFHCLTVALQQYAAVLHWGAADCSEAVALICRDYWHCWHVTNGNKLGVKAKLWLNSTFVCRHGEHKVANKQSKRLSGNIREAMSYTLHWGSWLLLHWSLKLSFPKIWPWTFYMKWERQKANHNPSVLQTVSQSDWLSVTLKIHLSVWKCSFHGVYFLVHSNFLY